MCGKPSSDSKLLSTPKADLWNGPAFNLVQSVDTFGQSFHIGKVPSASYNLLMDDDE